MQSQEKKTLSIAECDRKTKNNNDYNIISVVLNSEWSSKSLEHLRKFKFSWPTPNLLNQNLEVVGEFGKALFTASDSKNKD